MRLFISKLKLQDSSFMGHLNYIGMILFSIIVLSITGIIPTNYISYFIFITLYIVGTTNINNVVFPYRKQQPPLLYVSKKFLLRHWFFTIITNHCLSLFLVALLIINYAIQTNKYIIILVSLILILSNYLSNLSYGIFKLLLRLLISLQMLAIIFNVLWVVPIIFALHCLIIISLINFSHLKFFDLSYLLKFEKNNKNTNILKLTLAYMKKNSIAFFLIGIFIIFIFYILQLIFVKLHNLPASMIIFIFLLVVLEALIGSKKQEITFDKSRVETLLSSNILSIYKRFTSSTLYLIILLMIYISFFGLIGTILFSFEPMLILKNVLSFPIILFIGLVYFRKKESLILEENIYLFKFTYAIIMAIIITIYLLFI